jgi:hypothetical protein
MNINIGAKKPIDGDQVFLVGSFLTAADPPFVLLYDAAKGRRAKRNIQKIGPMQVVGSIGSDHFIEVEYPRWGKVWIRSSSVRGVRECSEDEMRYSPEEIGSLVLFNHDPTPEDEHAGFFFFGMPARLVAPLLNREVE